MASHRFECVAGLEDWLSTVQFTYVGSSPMKAPAVFELSNRTEEQERRLLREEQQLQQKATANDASKAAAAANTTASTVPPSAISMAEQLVEHVVRLLQTGMRGGLRGALEVIKILDRLPDQVVVPYPEVSFSSSMLQKPSLWFRSEQEMEQAISDPAASLQSNYNNNNNKWQSSGKPAAGGGGIAAFLKGCKIAMLPTKFVKSTLFLVNSAAAAVNDGGNTSSISKSAGSQIRMFVRVCLQQRCLLAVFEFLLGFLGSADGVLADFLYIHPSASPLLHEHTLPQLFAALRRFGGPPLVVRAVAHATGVSIGPLLESPWDPVACGCTEQPVLATWSMWFAKEGLRLKWNLEYNLGSDAQQPDYVAVDGLVLNNGGRGAGGPQSPGSMLSPGSSKQLLSPGSAHNNSNNNNNRDPTPRTDRRGGGDDDDDKGSVAGSTTRTMRKIIIRTKTKSVKGPGGGENSYAAGISSPGLTGDAMSTDAGGDDHSSGNMSSSSSSLAAAAQQRPRARTITVSSSGKQPVAAPATGNGQSPRPSTTVQASEVSSSSTSHNKDTHPRLPTLQLTPAVSNRHRSQDASASSDVSPALSSTSVSETPTPNRDMMRQPQQQGHVFSEEASLLTKQQVHEKTLAKIETDKQQFIARVESQRRKHEDFVDGTIARWEEERREFEQTALADAVQPLLEAYASLVYAKFAASLNRSALAEQRLMSCHDLDAIRAAMALDSDDNANHVTPQRGVMNVATAADQLK